MTTTRFAQLAAFVALFAITVLMCAGDPSPSVAVWTLLYSGAAVFGSLRRAVIAGARARAHQRSEVAALEQPLREGAFVLAGKVAYGKEQPEAMRVEITQHGTEVEGSGGSWRHKWTEVHRKLTVHPFYVVRSSGERVRVEPTPDESRLFDELENKILVQEHVPIETKHSGPLRTRVATLMPDEHVWVTGPLSRVFDLDVGVAVETAGHRESAGPSALVMRGEPTLLVSSVSLTDHFRQRSQKHVKHAFFLLLVGSVPAVVLARYVDRTQGETVTATVEAVSEVTGDEGRMEGYRAYARHDRRTFESDVLRQSPAIGSTLPFRVGEWSDNQGSVACIGAGELGLSYLFCAFAIIAHCTSVVTSISSLPWYRSEKVKFEEGGRGRLQMS